MPPEIYQDDPQWSKAATSGQYKQVPTSPLEKIQGKGGAKLVAIEGANTSVGSPTITPPVSTTGPIGPAGAGIPTPNTTGRGTGGNLLPGGEGSPSTTGSTIYQSLIKAGWSPDDLVGMTAAQLYNLAQDMGIVSIPKAGGYAPPNPDSVANAIGQNILNNFNPTTDFIKLPGLENQYLIRGTNKTVDMSDPSKFNPINNPDGTFSGFLVNSKGETFNAQGNQIAKDAALEAIRHNQATEGIANAQVASTNRTTDINAGLTQQQIDATKARDAANANNQAAQLRAQQLDTAAKLAADPGNFVQAEYQRRGLTPPVTPLSPEEAAAKATSDAAQLAAAQEFQRANARAVTANVEYNTAHPPGQAATNIQPVGVSQWVPPKGMTLIGDQPPTTAPVKPTIPSTVLDWSAWGGAPAGAPLTLPSNIPKLAYGTRNGIISSNLPNPDPSIAPKGMSESGNIDLNNRPQISNPDGSISTIRSISIEQDGKVYLIPTVVGNKVVSNDEAVAHFRATGQHLGVFKDEQSATGYAEQLHQQQANMLPKYSTGTLAGMTTAPRLITGDPQAGQVTGNPEEINNPTGAPISVQPLDDQQQMANGIPPDGQINGSQPTTGQQTEPFNPAQDTVVTISKIMALVGKMIKPGKGAEVAHDIGSILMEHLKEENGESSPSSVSPTGRLISGNMPPMGDTTGVPKYAYGTDSGENTSDTPLDSYTARGVGLAAPYISSGNSGGVISRAASVATPIQNTATSTIPVDPNAELLRQLNAQGFSTTDPTAIQGLPSIKELSGDQPYTYGEGSFTGGFGTQLPGASRINYGRYLDIKQDPITYGVLSSLYRAGSRNIDSEASRAKQLAPIGSGIFSSAVRT